MKIYYLYRHIRPDKNQPFYIGMGKGRRFKYRTGRNNLWNKIVDKNDGVFKAEIILDNLTLDEAYLKEKEFISLYGRIEDNSGILSNLTFGGEAIYPMTQEIRKKISIANKGKKRSDEYKKLTSIRHTGRKHSEETKIKIGKSNIGKHSNHIFSEERKLACKERSMGTKNSHYKGSIKMYSISGVLLNTFSTPADIKEYLNIKSDKNNLTLIYACIRGDRKTYMGYKWSR